MEENVWKLEIERVSNGYNLRGKFGDSDIVLTMVIEDGDTDELYASERLLCEVMDYFNLCGSKHDKERIRIVREKYEGTGVEEDYEKHQESLLMTGIDNHLEGEGGR